MPPSLAIPFFNFYFLFIFNILLFGLLYRGSDLHHESDFLKTLKVVGKVATHEVPNTPTIFKKVAAVLKVQLLTVVVKVRPIANVKPTYSQFINSVSMKVSPFV